MTIDINHAQTVEVGYDEFCGALAARDLQPLWKIAKQLMPNVPLPTTQAWLWKWDDVQPLAKRAGELITLERGGDRRVLALANPGLRGLPFTSTTLWGAFQYLGPHESAPAHRHTPNGVRFDWEPGDSFVTPSWASVDHQATEQADLFAVSDRPVLQSLHLFREEALLEHQEIGGTFVPLKGMVSATAAKLQESPS